MHGELEAGPVHWIDHYTIPTNDFGISIPFYERALGLKTQDGPMFRKLGRMFQLNEPCRHGLFRQDEPLPAREPLGKGYPRQAWFIRPQDVGAHVRRLNECGVEHSGPQQVTGEGESGTAIYFWDPEGNQLEFWAPNQPPKGALDTQNIFGVGRISHVVHASRDLKRTAAFFSRYCALRPVLDTALDTLVLPFASGSRLIFKRTSLPGRRTSGGGVYFDLHTALLVRESDFWPNYERIWNELPEWTWFESKGRYRGDGYALPPRTLEHPTPAGQKLKAVFGRGDDWFDWDGNLFHFYGGESDDLSMATYKRHAIEHYLDAYLSEHPRSANLATVT